MNLRLSYQPLLFVLLSLVLLISSGCASTRPRQLAAAPVLTEKNRVLDVNILVFKNIPVFSPFADGNYWYLRSALIWESARKEVITVPAGFVTDFTSVPRGLWNILPKWEKYGPAAIVHDYLYWDQQVERKTADKMMLEAMDDSDVNCFKRYLIYATLRSFGSFAWNNNAREKLEGRPRQLWPHQYPVDPSETWAQCEQRIRQEP